MWSVSVGDQAPDYGSDEKLFTIWLHYNGLLKTGLNARCYVGRKSKFIDWVNTDEISMIEIGHMVKEVGVTRDVLYYYRVPARDLYHGLRKLIKDDDCLEMATWVQLSKTIEVYVQRATMSEDEGERHMDEDGSQDEGGSEDGEGGDDSHESTKLEEFVDSECDKSEDDRFFDINVDKEVEWGGLSYGKGKAPLESKQTGEDDVYDQEAQSDELVSLYGSSAEEEEGGPPKDRFSQFNMATDIADPKFKVGMIFPTRKQFKLVVKEHAIKTRKPIMLVKNDKQRVRVICKDKKCVKWVLLASKMQGSKSFQVKKYVPTHTCKRVFYNKHVTAKWLSRKYVETLRSNPTWPVKSFKDQVQQDLKVGVSRAQLYKAKTLALEMIEGSHVQQYEKLPDYCEELRRTNPDTTVILKTIEDEESGGRQRFERLYVCLGACKRGFLAGCRPVIGLDGCFLKGPYQGQLLLTVGIDGNNQSYVVSYAVVEAENKPSWKWFMEILAEDLHIGNNFTFISNKQKGLKAAIAEVVPYAEHRFCIRHFYNNFKETNKGLHLKEILFSAAKATYVAKFNFHMQEMNEADEAAVKWLNEHPPQHWSRSHFCTHSKCEVLDNNMCESFNDTILEARGKTIIPMLEEIRVTLMLRMQKRREAMRAYEGDICPNIRGRLNNRIDEAGSNCIAQWSGDKLYQVNCFSGQQFTCDLATHTCSCRKWDLTGFPCPYAIAAINECHEDVDDYVDHWFRKETYMKSYEPIVYPLNGIEMWTHTGVLGLIPPNVKKQAGRPKKLRKRGNDEPRDSTKLKRRNTTTTCSKCGKLGHNKRSCKGQPLARNESGTRQRLPLKSNDRSGTPQRSSQAPQSSSQPTVATPTRRSQRQAQQSSSQPPPTTRSSLGGSRGRKKGAQAGGRK